MSPSQKQRARRPHQLPPGRHGLSRGFVQSNQRSRILDAVVDVTSSHGYVDTSVEDIIVMAGVSRRTFYDNFEDKEAAFLAAYDGIVARLAERMNDAFSAAGAFASRVRDCLAAFLYFLAAEPQSAVLCIVEVFAAGPNAVERRTALMREFAELIRAASDDLGASAIRPPELTAETIVGGVYEVVYSRVLHGESGCLAELQEDLAYSMMLPYLGHVRAAREAAKSPALPLPTAPGPS